MLNWKYAKYLALFMLLVPCCVFASNLDQDIAAFNLITDYRLLFFGGVFVIFVQAGFAIVEGGYQFNLKSIFALLISYLSSILGAVLFGLLCVWGIHFGVIDHPNDKPYFYSGWHRNLLFFYILMATTITTVVGRIIPNKSSLIMSWGMGLTISAIIFPFFSSWVWGNILWGGGWLKNIGFIDFAGSTVVHSAAAWVLLAGYLTLKSAGKEEEKKKNLIFEDYRILSFAVAGFILWLAWSGLNVVYITAIPVDVSVVVSNAFISLFTAFIAALILVSAFDRRMISWNELIKSALGGLVAITASCGFVDYFTATLIGAVAGLLTVYVPRILIHRVTSRHVRDVIAVHGMCGVWGTLAVAMVESSMGLSIAEAFVVQSFGVLVNFVWSFGLGYLVFKQLSKMNFL